MAHGRGWSALPLLARPARLLLAVGMASATACAAADPPPRPAPTETFRVLSWNVAGDAFVTRPSEFHALLRWGDPDIVLLDEVAPATDTATLAKALAGLRPGDDRSWHIDRGASGGRQRGVVASRAPQEALPELASMVPYPDADRREIVEAMPEAEQDERPRPNWDMSGGIPVHGAVILVGGRRLLAVVADLQCCGSEDPGGWQESKRRVEVREIRNIVRRILARTEVDGIVLAGDLNLVASAFPLALLTGPYPAPHAGLIPAELYHPDGRTVWTWDGRGTPYPSGTLDFQVYDPDDLSVRSGLILDTEDLSPELLERHGLESGTSGRAGDHRPLVVEYGWTRAAPETEMQTETETEMEQEAGGP